MKLAGFMLFIINSAASINLKYISKRNSVDGCIDWSVDLKTYRVLAGEPLRVKCALFYSYIRTNYSVAQNAKLRLIWYRNKGDSEEPIIFSGHRLSKEGDSIWFRSAEMEDNGFYTCVLRNSTYCMKVSMSLTVEESEEGLCFSSRIRYQERAEITKSKMISCPDIDDYLAPYKQPIMTWYKECQRKEWRSSIIINTTSLWIPEVQEDDGGNYTCELKYGSKVVRRTTELKVTALLTTRPPKVLFPSERQASVIDVQLGMRLILDCKAFFGYSGDSKPIIYWMKGDKFVEELEGHIRESEVRVVREFLGEKEVELSLVFDAVEDTDMGNYTCNVENHIGRGSGSAILQKKDMYRLELVGGLGAIMLLLGIFTAIYKCYNVEIMLCYRQHFGSDEADDGNKEYDAYLSYTKVDLDSVEQEMSEEEQFALEILPDVLEKHYGYKLFIPHRDLIPSSTYIEDLARSVEQSRRLIIVLTPEFVARRGWSIFQFEPRLHSMLVTGEIKVIMIECPDLRSVINYQEVEDLKHTIRVLTLIKWQGPKSNQLKSKFWKQVRYEMPAKKKETMSRRQVLDSGEQGLFGDLQAVSTVAMTATSASLAPTQVEIPDYNEPSHMQMRHFCRSYEYELPTTAIATLNGRHMYCNLPMTLLNGRLTQNNIGKGKKEIHLNSSFVPLSGQELSSDIW
ncbi:X-linked interleukin-1 receptor accessory protein-like 2 isoform X1 [Danio rerio]|uniref:Interleukin 1-receptor accessory protein-like 2 n=2 Tax=Danio rerio TaxID=7955 RepID=B6ZK78_DANRE|nr:X-linked interleukin-1 receptor accessory protein-like 2 precursor [Danio rerio]BAG85348.1 interleukin 1-receptor accessory protein-like 2 [Danio rerio]|eukprot:NP_001136056.1 X-linked interleukin-1 receptor accessory protein-like 2 precursor [Danio rerio]